MNISTDGSCRRIRSWNVRGDARRRCTCRSEVQNLPWAPSYEESVRGLTVTGDLIATIYRGLKSYAQIQRLGGNEEAALHYESKAEEYARLYNTGWWNEETQNYYAYKLENENLKEGGCNVFLFGSVS